MATIDVGQAQTGMILVADVLDRRGRLLIPAGKELSEKHLGALPAWGVTHIEVEGDDLGGADVCEIEPWAREAAEAEISRLFSKVNRDHPLAAALADVCTGRKAAQLQTAQGDGGAP